MGQAAGVVSPGGCVRQAGREKELLPEGTAQGALRRFAIEYQSLSRALSKGDFLALLLRTARVSPEILRTRKLTALDAAMSRDLTVDYRGHRISVPVAKIDRVLAENHDNPTFGNIREMYAGDCYLRRFQVNGPVNAALDLGANRGLFSLLALVVLDAECVVGVEPLGIYEPVARLLLEANRIASGRAVRYQKLIGSSSEEKENPVKFVSINRIRAEQKIDRFGLVKIDIEGGERALFNEPDWLQHVDAITMELHSGLVGDLSVIPEALERYGFRYISTDDRGQKCAFPVASYLYASRATAALTVQAQGA